MGLRSDDADSFAQGNMQAGYDALDAENKQLRTQLAAMELSPEVLAFALLMEKTLSKPRNENKGGWQGESIHYLLSRMVDELGEVLECVPTHSKYDGSRDEWLRETMYMISQRVLGMTPRCEEEGQKNAKQIIKECVDLGNFAMMLADILGGLK